MKGRRIFVSGGAGVIGTVLVQKLRERGAEVWVGDLKPRPESFDSGVRYRCGDLNSLTFAEVAEFDPQVFIHLAATFERSTETPDFWSENFHHNVRLSSHLGSLLREARALRRLVFASSYLVYDPRLYLFAKPQASPRSLVESDQVMPRNLCGAAKLYHELELRFLTQFMSACEVVNARIFRGYGLGSRDVISRWVRALLQKEPIQTFRVEGRFDFTFAEDSAEALLRLAESAASGAINVGSGRARAVAEALDVLRAHFPAMRVESQPSDIPFEASQADIGRLREATRWQPAFTLETAIPRIIRYEEERLRAESGSHRKQMTAATRGAVMVTSVSRKTALVGAVRNALARVDESARVLGGDADPHSIARHFVDDFWVMPRLADLPVDEFVRECRVRDVHYVIPTRDGELEYFAAASASLASAGVAAMISSPQAVRACRDKVQFASVLAAAGLQPISTELTAEAIEAPRLVVKERFGSGSRGIALDVSLTEAKARASTLEQAVFQPFVAGIEYSADVYVSRKGKCHGCVVRRRDVVVGGESQVTTSVRHPAAEAACARAAEALGIAGHAILQFIEDDRGRLRFVECNPRFGGASSLSVAMGLDSFYWFFLESGGVDLSSQPFVRAAGDKTQIRYPADRLLDAAARPAHGE